MADQKDESGEKKRVQKDGVSHDQRGNAVWKWAADSGRHLMESTTALLKRLEVPGLKLEEDVRGPSKQPGLELEEGGAAKGNVGYDPYGGSRRVTPGAAVRTPVAPRPAATKPAAAPPPRRSLLGRWFGKD